MIGFFMMANPISQSNDHPSVDLVYQSISDQTPTDENGVVHVSTPLILLSALPLLCIAFIGHKFDFGLENTLVVGISRSFVQLMILGLILHPIFLMGMDWPWLVCLYVLFMILIATKESMSRPKYTYQYHPLMTFLALLLSITSVGTFAFLFIIRPDPRWNPQYVIPICGMLMGNCINGVSLTVNNLSTQIMEGGRREIELNLSFGASGWESVGRLVKGAVGAGVTPITSMMNVIGLVSIPGMMTGQILGGSPVTEAAHYQILIIYLIATCTFTCIFCNVFILYRVAFDAKTHVLRTDRFIEVVNKKHQKNSQRVGITVKLAIQNCYEIGIRFIKAFVCCCGLWGRKQDGSGNAVPNVFEGQPLIEAVFNDTESKYGSSNSLLSNRIQILTHRLTSDGSNSIAPFFRITKLQFSVPKSHTKKRRNGNSDAQSSPLPPSHLSSVPDNKQSTPQLQPQLQQERVLCTNLNASLHKGEIGIVRGPSGSGKSTLLRVLSGLTQMDDGDVNVSGLSLAGCFGQDDHDFSHTNMVHWRTIVRYVTQYKVDIPGTPRDFILRIVLFHSYSKFDNPSEDEMVSQTISYLQDWGMEESHSKSEYEHSHPYLDKEWKTLSGGESQRTLLAIAMASRPQILLLDEATSGLDAKTEKCVEESVVDYVKRYGAAVLWVTHSEDIADRLLVL